MKRMLTLLLCLAVAGITHQASAWYHDRGPYYGYDYYGPDYGPYGYGPIADTGAAVGNVAEGVGAGVGNVLDGIFGH